MANYKWNPMEIDLHAFMEFIREMGAANISEIKKHFATDSESVRSVVGYLYHHRKILIVPASLGHGLGLYIIEPTGKKGSPNVKKIRRKAQKENGRP